MSLVHPFFTIRSWWVDALVAWQPFNASSDKCTAVHTRILVNDIYRLMFIENIFVIHKQFLYFSKIYLKKTRIENNPLTKVCTVLFRTKSWRKAARPGMQDIYLFTSSRSFITCAWKEEKLLSKILRR